MPLALVALAQRCQRLLLLCVVFPVLVIPLCILCPLADALYLATCCAIFIVRDSDLVSVLLVASAVALLAS